MAGAVDFWQARPTRGSHIDVLPLQLLRSIPQNPGKTEA